MKSVERVLPGMERHRSDWRDNPKQNERPKGDRLIARIAKETDFFILAMTIRLKNPERSEGASEASDQAARRVL